MLALKVLQKIAYGPCDGLRECVLCACARLIFDSENEFCLLGIRGWSDFGSESLRLLGGKIKR